MLNFILGIILLLYLYGDNIEAEETTVNEISILGATLEQEIEYNTSKEDFDARKNETFKKLKAGEPVINTKATIGIKTPTVGIFMGRKYERTFSAEEKALEESNK